MRRAATSTPTASVRNLLLAGALTLVVVLVLVAEMSTVETTPGASGREERLVKAVEERRVAEARRTGPAKRRRAEAAAARAGEGGAADGAGAVRAATMVHMIHVPKTGGESAGIFLKRLGRNGFSMYRGKSGKESPHSIVDQSKVQ